MNKEFSEQDQYLETEYGVVCDSERLKSESDIKGYFKDMWCELDMLDCGQGYSTPEESRTIMIGSDFFEVTITADIMSAKQDRGDRLYWVDYITDISWEKTTKPLKKETSIIGLKLRVNAGQEEGLYSFIARNHIEIIDD